MTTSTHVREASLRRPALAVVGGLLWLPYGVLELLEPWGQDVRYDQSLGYDVVLDRQLFTLYSLPGALAVILCAVALLDLQQRMGVASRGARGTAAAAAALGAISLLGVVLGFDPAFTGGRIVGTLVLGAAVLLTATRAGRPWRARLVALGILAMFLLPVWPLVFAVGWLSPSVGAAALGLHGAAWFAVGAAAAGPTRTTRALPSYGTGGARHDRRRPDDRSSLRVTAVAATATRRRADAACPSVPGPQPPVLSPAPATSGGVPCRTSQD